MALRGAQQLVAEQPYAIALGRAVRWLRQQRRVSQAALAAASGISQPTLSRFERGEGQPDALTLRRLSAALGISLEELNARVDDALRRAEKATASTVHQSAAKSASWWEDASAVAGVVGLVALIGFAIAAVFGESGAQTPKK